MEALTFTSVCCINSPCSSSHFPNFKSRNNDNKPSFSIPVQSQPSVRRPDVDHWSNPASTSAPSYNNGRTSRLARKNVDSSHCSNYNNELEMFLDLVPLRMRRELVNHGEIGKLIEVVMDLGRKSITRFPSGDFVISEQVICMDDLKHAISKHVMMIADVVRELHHIIYIIFTTITSLLDDVVREYKARYGKKSSTGKSLNSPLSINSDALDNYGNNCFYEDEFDTFSPFDGYNAFVFYEFSPPLSGSFG